jgi:hypothetical protein
LVGGSSPSPRTLRLYLSRQRVRSNAPECRGFNSYQAHLVDFDGDTGEVVALVCLGGNHGVDLVVGKTEPVHFALFVVNPGENSLGAGAGDGDRQFVCRRHVFNIPKPL